MRMLDRTGICVAILLKKNSGNAYVLSLQKINHQLQVSAQMVNVSI